MNTLLLSDTKVQDMLEGLTKRKAEADEMFTSLKAEASVSDKAEADKIRKANLFYVAQGLPDLVVDLNTTPEKVVEYKPLPKIFGIFDGGSVETDVTKYRTLSDKIKTVQEFLDKVGTEHCLEVNVNFQESQWFDLNRRRVIPSILTLDQYGACVKVAYTEGIAYPLQIEYPMNITLPRLEALIKELVVLTACVTCEVDSLWMVDVMDLINTPCREIVVGE